MLYSESGNSVRLRCSAAECNTSLEGFSGMYLYKKFVEGEEEVLYHSFKEGREEVVTPGEAFENRTQVDGTLQDKNITISNLSVHDSGIYSCEFAKLPNQRARCSTYLLAVKGALFFHTVQTRVSLLNDLVYSFIFHTIAFRYGNGPSFYFTGFKGPVCDM